MIRIRWQPHGGARVVEGGHRRRQRFRHRACDEEEDGIVALVMMRPEAVGAWVARHLGDGWGVFSWDGFMGESAVVVPAA